jgi:F1F0 ATPase subunit 2
VSLTIGLLLAFAGGLAVGWGWLYGLHRTVRALPETSSPGLLVAVSLLLRMGLLLAGLGLLMRSGAALPHLLAAAAGLVLMRFLLVRRLGVGRIEQGGTAP